MERVCRWKRYGAHEQIFDPQSPTRDMYFIVEGRAMVVIYSMSGLEVTYDDITEGNVFGELLAVDGQPRSTSVVALAKSLVAAMPPDAFLEMLARHPEVSQRLTRRMAQIIRTSTESILDLSTMAANNWVHAELLRLARGAMNGSTANVATLQPIPVHGDIAARVSTTRETVARVLSDLARYGLVKRTKNVLVVTDVRKLSHMVADVRGEETVNIPPPVIRVTVRSSAAI